MKPSCNCVENVRVDSFEQVPFRICLNCQFLEWDHTSGQSFISPKYILKVTLPRAVTIEVSVFDFLEWLEAQLGEKLNKTHGQFRVDFDWLGFYQMDEQLSWDDLLTGESEDSVFSVQLIQVVKWWRLQVQTELEQGDDLDTLTSIGHFIESRLTQYSTDELLTGTLDDMRDHYGEYLLKDTGHRVAETISKLIFKDKSISAVLEDYSE